jgi:two-component system response regulator RegX3
LSLRYDDQCDIEQRLHVRPRLERVLVNTEDGFPVDALVQALCRQGFDAQRVEIWPAHPADGVLVIGLDLHPIHGHELIRRWRAAGVGAPILVVTHRSAVVDRVLTLEFGADDVVSAPVDLIEVVARVRALARRVQPLVNGESSPTEVGPVRIDARTRTVTVDEVAVDLTAREFDLLEFLASDPGAVRGRVEIMVRVWRSEALGSTKTIDAHVASLRRKLDGALSVETVRGVGFRVSAVRSNPAARQSFISSLG